MQERLMNNRKINVEWDSVVEEVVGTENPLGVTGVKVKNVKTDAVKELPSKACSSPSGTTPIPIYSKAKLTWIPKATS